MVSEGEEASFPLHPRKPGVELDYGCLLAHIQGIYSVEGRILLLKLKAWPAWRRPFM